MPASRLDRRQILRLGLVLGLSPTALVGCSTDGSAPTPPSSGTASGATTGAPAPGPSTAPPRPTLTPTPTPTAALGVAAQTEQTLGALAAAILTGPHRKQLSTRRKRLLGFLRDAHRAHAAALVSPAPSARPAAISSLTLSASLRLLRKREAAAARAHRSAALAAGGPVALLLGSMSAAAATYGAAATTKKPPAVGRLRTPRVDTTLTDVAATQELVRQLHAVVYGYQLAIGQLKVTSSAHTRAVAELLDARKLREDLIADLDARKADVPAAAPAYVPSTVPRNPATSARLLRQLQTRLEPFCGLTIAASARRADRARGLEALTVTTNRALGWGASLQAWPGRDA